MNRMAWFILFIPSKHHVLQESTKLLHDGGFVEQLTEVWGVQNAKVFVYWKPNYICVQSV